MANAKDHTGKEYVNLVALARRQVVTASGLRTQYKCRCTCGDERWYWAGNLQSGASTKCLDCAKKIQKHLTHGLSATRTYHVWYKTIIKKAHARRWDSLEAFVADMGLGRDDEYMCRKDITKPFSKGNCYWGPRAQRCRGVVFRGKNMMAWASEFGISRQRLHQLLQKMSFEEVYRQRHRNGSSKTLLMLTSPLPTRPPERMHRIKLKDRHARR